MSASTAIISILKNDSPGLGHGQILANMTQFRKVSAQQETRSVLRLSPEATTQTTVPSASTWASQGVERMLAYLLTHTPAGNACPGGIYCPKSQFPVQTRSCLSGPIKRGVSLAFAAAWLHLSCCLILNSRAGFSVETPPRTQQADCATLRCPGRATRHSAPGCLSHRPMSCIGPSLLRAILGHFKAHGVRGLN